MNKMKPRTVRNNHSKSQNASYSSHYHTLLNKQNQHPNLNTNTHNSKSSSHKKKILLVRHKNSKSRSISSSQRKYSIEQFKTQVSPFEEISIKQQPTITIDLDLHKHRKSVQDTMSSSEFRNVGESIMEKCKNHPTKKAGYLVKGQPYCEKCAVQLITKKGMIAIKIDKEDGVKEGREKILENFIVQIQKIQPFYKQMTTKLDKCQEMLELHYREEEKKMEMVWESLIQKLTIAQRQWQNQSNQQYRSAVKTIEELKKRVNSHLEYVVFMRNDIVCNIGEIINPNNISQLKFNNVIKNYQQQLTAIRSTIEKASSTQINISITNENKLDKATQEISQLFTPEIQSYQLNMGEQEMPNKTLVLDVSDADPYRLSFGTEPERICSPSFKVI